MSISDYNLSGEQKRNLFHFASVVKLALEDNIITIEEEKLLKRLAKRFHISDEKYKQIIENPEEYPIDTPHSYDERIERLYDLIKMVFADGSVSSHELHVLKKISLGLGFSLQNVDNVVSEAVKSLENDLDLEDFSKAIKRSNKI
ncbi:TerB family tellurite resistance protein [Lutibacter sp.]|uniref:TerB family tellurite resistance protein n=1 Tax=Lutibacter sp. TaxID=1925666 RepID=UPI0027328331|nr:TerB family tellurite resistance protein [Lutibacter sp.]MDP3313156.1 TerB family tellurite resistance protein [Lutibacter sp.]